MGESRPCLSSPLRRGHGSNKGLRCSALPWITPGEFNPNLTFDLLLTCKPALYPLAGFKQALKASYNKMAAAAGVARMLLKLGRCGRPSSIGLKAGKRIGAGTLLPARR
jgi:hypothetical protein